MTTRREAQKILKQIGALLAERKRIRARGERQREELREIIEPKEAKR